MVNQVVHCNEDDDEKRQSLASAPVHRPLLVTRNSLYNYKWRHRELNVLPSFSTTTDKTSVLEVSQGMKQRTQQMKFLHLVHLEMKNAEQHKQNDNNNNTTVNRRKLIHFPKHSFASNTATQDSIVLTIPGSIERAAADQRRQQQLAEQKLAEEKCRQEEEATAELERQQQREKEKQLEAERQEEAKRREEELMRKQREFEVAEAKRKAEEEEENKKKLEDELKKKRIEEEELRKNAEEKESRKQIENEEYRQKAEEEAKQRQKLQQEEEDRRKKQQKELEEEEHRKQQAAQQEEKAKADAEAEAEAQAAIQLKDEEKDTIQTQERQAGTESESICSFDYSNDLTSAAHQSFAQLLNENIQESEFDTIDWQTAESRISNDQRYKAVVSTLERQSLFEKWRKYKLDEKQNQSADFMQRSVKVTEASELIETLAVFAEQQVEAAKKQSEAELQRQKTIDEQRTSLSIQLAGKVAQHSNNKHNHSNDCVML